MSLLDCISVNSSYTRAVNLERDSGSDSVVRAYVPTVRAISTFKDVIQTIEDAALPKAWSLIGPYGSGKSTFAVYLSHLLGDPAEVINQYALDKLEETDNEIAANFKNHIDKTNGYCSVLLTGSPESLGRRLVKAIHQKADAIWSKRRGAQPKFIKDLKALSARKEQPSTTEVIDAIRQFQDKLAPLNYKGILLQIDELGKFLEYEARHSEGRDIFLLQSIAEETISDKKVNLVFVVMMHQAFEQYAKGLSDTLKNEWSKIQGRFENIPFLENAEQTLRVVSKAIEKELDQSQTKIVAKNIYSIVKGLESEKAMPGTMDVNTASLLFEKCYPLHPITALVLPLLCQKVAQNERTLFNYLGSKEPFGFHESVEQLKSVNEWVLPSQLFEYFITNQSSILSDHMTSRRWAEVITAIERLGDASQDEIELLKTIGLLNIIGAQSGFKASKKILEQCFAKSKLTKALKELQNKSIIQYRKFSSEYRVWQGSDFDLEFELESEISKIGDIDLPDILNNKHKPLPLVARRYSIENGAIRYFVPIFIDKNTTHLIENESEDARIIYYLSDSYSDQKDFIELRDGKITNRDVIVLCEDISSLRSAAGEVIALENIQAASQELESDPVAHHEFKERYKDAALVEKGLVENFFKKPNLFKWYAQKDLLRVDSQRELQYVLSEILETAYHKAPVIKNELINRDKLSSQASAAKNKLAMAMFLNESKKDLAFEEEKYPPEKSIYRSLFEVSKIHRRVDGEWKFVGIESGKDDPNNFYPLWQRLNKFFDSTEDKPRSLVELNKELFAPPYGIKVGVLSLIYISALLSYKNELAIYENGIYTPELAEEQIERFLKRPDTFTVQRFQISGVNESIHKTYSNTLFNDGKHRSLLVIAKPIAKMVLDLPEYVQKTQRGLSRRSIALREAVKFSKSPIALMLEGIPKALDIDLEALNSDAKSVDGLSIRLIESLKELKYGLKSLKQQLVADLVKGFGFDDNTSLSKLQESLSGRCYGLEDYTIDRDGLKAFIQRAQNTNQDEETWLEGILSFLAKRPVDKWIDSDIDNVHLKINEYARKINDLESLRVQYQRVDINDIGDFDVYLLRSVKKGDKDFDDVVVVTEEKRRLTQAAKSVIEEQLSGLDKDLKLALLAEIIDDSLKHDVDSVIQKELELKTVEG